MGNQWRRKEYKDKLYPKDRDNLQTLKFVIQRCFLTQYEIILKKLAKQIQTVQSERLLGLHTKNKKTTSFRGIARVQKPLFTVWRKWRRPISLGTQSQKTVQILRWKHIKYLQLYQQFSPKNKRVLVIVLVQYFPSWSQNPAVNDHDRLFFLIQNLNLLYDYNINCFGLDMRLRHS